ncbi:thiol:disulfide interchange protein DsbA/DsbL [Neisseriaceae bacterium CLB008]|nr:thiol:disulfide interchange protein DsbA/DsbL [Neisseriaceae bacterium]
MNFKQWLFPAAMMLSFSVAQAAIVEGRDYEVLKAPIAQSNKTKVEVLEFFSYTCIHCRNLEPHFVKYTQKAPSDVTFRQVHIVWGDNMLPWAKLAAAVNMSKANTTVGPAIFNTVFNEKRNLANPKVMKEWLDKQTTPAGKLVAKNFNSFAAANEAKAMQKMTMDYKIDSTPRLIVGGKYQVIMRDVNTAMNVVDELVQKVRQERGMKKPA